MIREVRLRLLNQWLQGGALFQIRNGFPLFPQQKQEELSGENPGGQDAEAEKGTIDASSHF